MTEAEFFGDSAHHHDAMERPAQAEPKETFTESSTHPVSHSEQARVTQVALHDDQPAHTPPGGDENALRVVDWDEFKLEGDTSVQEVDFTELDKRRIDPANPPEAPVDLVCLNGHQICTAGNLTTISAQAKAGKSGVLTGILAAVLSPITCIELGKPCRDYLGFSAEPSDGRAVICFDTEQSPFDACKLHQRSLKRGQVDALPRNFRCYYLADIGTEKRRVYLSAEMARAQAKCGGIHIVIIDGVADLCKDPNDPEEAFGLVEELMQLAIKYNCPIINVLHENPSGTGQGYAKGRGHLGSQLERKSESNLRIEKDKDGISTIHSDRCRRASIPKSQGVRFQWCDEAGMHVTVYSIAAADKDAKKREEELPVVDAVFNDASGDLSYGELKARLGEHAGIKNRTAERRIKSWVGLGLISRRENGSYTRPQPSTVTPPSNQPS